MKPHIRRYRGGWAAFHSRESKRPYLMWGHGMTLAECLESHMWGRDEKQS